MSLITCTDPCVYQKDGYCSLSRAASPGVVCGQGCGCINFVPISLDSSQQSCQRLPDIGHPNQF